MPKRQKEKTFDKDFDKEFEEDMRELELQSKRFPTIIFSIFLGVAILTLTIAAILTFSASRKVLREESVQGYVVDLVVRKDQYGNDYYYPVVEFDLPDGTRLDVQLTQGSWPAPFVRGEPVTVAYDPAQPRKARIKTTEDTLVMYIGAMITGFIGVVFLGVSLAVRWLLKEPSESESGETEEAGEGTAI